jgi:ubiquitin-conjugating enzyme E2 O
VNLNGTTEVTLPHGDVQTYSIERLSRLSELLTDLFMDDDMLPHDHQHEGWIGEEDEGLWEEMVDDSDELDLWEDSAAPIETKAVPILIDNSSSDSLGRATMETESPSPPTSSAIFTDLDEEQWARFAVLPEAPIDHAFYPYRSPNVNKSFMGRLAKEHRALTSSLPGKPFHRYTLHCLMHS